MNTFKILIASAIICMSFWTTSATIRIVDNHVPTPAGAYATIQLAHDAASVGDTLMLVPSEAEYAGITITKTTHIIGNGWDPPATDISFTKTGGLSINADGTSIQGLRINGDCTILKNNVLIKRNNVNGKVRVGNSGIVNITIFQNYIKSTAGEALYVFANSSVIISNNIIFDNSSTGNCLYVEYPGNLIIKNNILSRSAGGNYVFRLGTSGNSYCNQEVTNNIIISGTVNGLTTPKNNICNSTQIPIAGGNLQNIDMSSVFVDMANNDYHLKAGSPAIGAGENGTDCGIYGGELGFVDKGVPGLPYIYYLQVPSIANKKDGLNVTVKAKSGN